MEISAGGFGRQLPEIFEDIGDDDGLVDEDDMFDDVNNANSGGVKDKDPGFDGRSNKGDADGGKEAKFLPIRGLVVEWIVKMSKKVKKDEMSLYNLVFASKRDYGEEIWNIGSGHVLHQGSAYHFKSNTFIHVIIIDCWSSLLNKMEELRDVGSVSRLFFDTIFLAEEILGGSLSPEITQ
ncbi:unnamed protein product [Lactuca saligna]|uniref:Uncharacterized protein n=1 Tax=Lactuca saligna TaxID=75948 RepID=A0AA35ZGB3_LACSI|nr:unnamed protein product [Lactuca saligna]